MATNPLDEATRRTTDAGLGQVVIIILYVTVVTAYLSTLLDRGWYAANADRVGPLLFLGVLFVIGYHGGALLVDRTQGWAAGTVFIVVLEVLAVVIIVYGGGGNLWIITLPLVGHAMGLPRALGIALSILIFASVVAILFGSNASWGDVAGNSLSLGTIFIFVMLFSSMTIRAETQSREVSRLATELQDANQRLRTYAMQIEELAIAQERNRLAREIHDTLGHYLTVINVQLEAAQTLLEKQPEQARDAIGKAQGLTREGLVDVRRSVAALREASVVENRPVPDAVADLVAETNAAGIHSQLAVHGEPRNLAPQSSLTLYRAAQEALTNVRKHAHASRVDLTLDYRDPGAVTLQVQDNGVGATTTTDGFGLLGIRERVQLLQGTIKIETAPGAGFTLRLTIPG